ncbi:MAG: NUDIX hydrolase [Eubacteriales bacterium]|nr:NUDIX hydrolase [Eubacteriales bacterium]
MEHQLRRVERTLVYKGSVLDIYQDTMVLPGGKTEKWDFVSHRKGGACIVPVLPDGRILMIHQYRPAIDRETLELPAGARNSVDEDTAVTAARELEEETGYRAGRLTRLLQLKTAVAYCNEFTDVYLAEELERIGGQQLDEAEEIRVEAFSLQDLLGRIYAGQIQDSKTAAGILAYAAKK